MHPKNKYIQYDRTGEFLAFVLTNMYVKFTFHVNLLYILSVWIVGILRCFRDSHILQLTTFYMNSSEQLTLLGYNYIIGEHLNFILF